ncbi:MAG TPA: ATP-binding protein [Verrucomicrobiae bacterium]|jgi:signal transduction histidine kinase|nr:ATP-binding protein [Verrucomicrobiae bacterium]
MIANGAWLNAGAAVVDGEGRIVESNDEFAFWAGVPHVQGILLIDLVSEKYPAWSPHLKRLLDSADSFIAASLEDSSIDPSHWYSIEIARCGPFRFLRLSRSLPPARELTEGAWDNFLNEEGPRRELYARMLRAEGQLELLSGKWPGVLFSQRADLTFSFVSSKIEEWSGIPVEAWGRRPQRFWDVVHEADAGELQAQFSRCKSGEPVTTTFRVRHIKTGKVTYILERREAVRSGNGLVLGYDGAWVDVTRQTIAEKRLASAVWKETLGLLTMGLAHDFSNILAGVYSLSETYQSGFKPGDDLHEGFGLIKRNSMQATQLVQRVLSLHQGKIGQRNYYNVNELLNDTIEVVRKSVRRICLHTEFWTEQLPLYIDPIEFRQVLVNLTLNAADAMPEGGDVFFSTSLHDELPALAHFQGSIPKLPVVCIEVRDTGTGIAGQHLSQIFDPFFTTKPLNKGSGLGLYNAKLFVEKHAGAISVESVEDSGTTFRIWLPKANFTESERFQTELILGRKTLLLVETTGKSLDETAQCLRENGFYVATASSERNAVELLHSPDYQFDAVMALMNGHNRVSPRLFNEIGRLKLPIKKVVQIYGSNEDEHDRAVLKQADLVIGSEIPAGEIASRLREVLSRLS